MECYVVEKESGEVVAEIGPGDRILRAKSVTYLADTSPAPDGEFVKLPRSAAKAIRECKLTGADLEVFLHLVAHLRYCSNMAKYPNGRPVTKEALEQDLGLSRVTIYRAIGNLIRHGLVVEAKTQEGKVFVINPYVAHVGDRISNTTYDLFRLTRWAQCSKKASGPEA